ncbi:MAG: signal recognition particle protein [Deltaproteobacteria bacterium]|nr:signal recognition particle protein [Deltaproteobacteria bacterium]MBW2052708.1 signal recognition particle protein [Deltaproteobacteria bacterium]MBW2141202.1 signal recognition particle protein [Deltaproteobacteria bacterium]MBW2323064.1 signal recognition particle protein [Deltaproteobacteria bacterium]
MFDNLSEKLNDIFRKLKAHGKLTEENVKGGLREIRLALLEADVNYKVVKNLIENIRVRAVGQEVMGSLTPGQQVVKIVYEELTSLMGGTGQELDFSGRPPWILLLVGLQGSGKTTSAGKLAQHLKTKGRRPLLVPADVQRPAAIEQLIKLGDQVSVPVFPSTTDMNPVEIASKARANAGEYGCDTLILDTAGRLQIDEDLMEELKAIKSKLDPNEILLVADAMTGQEAVNVAKTFNKWLDLTGVILTKMEGDARGGAALSIKAVLDRPIKFVGVGEKLNALEPFHPDRVASRIMGQGDVLTLIEKAQETMDQEKALDLVRKLKKDEFTLDDFKDQIMQIKKLGSFDQIMGMIPGLGKLKKLKDMRPEETELKKIEAIINSMTPEERRNIAIFNASRRRRVARGSGTKVSDVNGLIKNFQQTKKMMKKVSGGGLKSLGRGMFPV